MVSKREVRRDRWLMDLESNLRTTASGRQVRIAVHRNGFDDVLHVADTVLVGPKVTPLWAKLDEFGVAVVDEEANRAEGWVVPGQRGVGRTQPFRPPVALQPGPEERQAVDRLVARLVEEEGVDEDDDRLPERLRRLGLRRLRVPSGVDVVDWIGQRVRADPQAAEGRIAPEYVFVTRQRVHPGDDPSSLPASAARPVPPKGTVGPDAIRVAVIDTGLPKDPMPGQDDFLPGVAGEGMVDDLEDPGTRQWPPDVPEEPGLALLGPAAGHGSFCAALVKRVAPEANVRVFGVAGVDGWVDETSLVTALWTAVDPQRPDGFKAHVVNLSLGGYAALVETRDKQLYWQAPLVLEAEIARVVAEGVAVVAAAGNDDSTDQELPAACPGVVGVAALTSDGVRWPYSNHGRWVRASALGANVCGWYVKGVENQFLVPGETADLFTNTDLNHAAWSGTSMAAALVSGYLAKALASGAHAGLTPGQVADLIAPPRPLGSTSDLGTFVPVGLDGQPPPPR